MNHPLARARWILLLLTLAAPDAHAQSPALAAGGRFAPDNVKVYGQQDEFYDPTVLRTLFLDFKQTGWHQLLMSYHHSNVDVPANLTVDGKTYPGVGVSYRGNSSFQMVRYDQKHSFSIDIDAADDKQRLYGFRSLKLLNANQDPSFLRTYLYHYIARQYKPAPRVNFVRVVVNGENWGIYVNVQAINSDFTKDQFGSGKGARWKVSNFPRGQGGLYYFGENVASYRATYEIKSQEDPKAWADLIALCRILNRTPPDKLPAALEPIFDVEGALKFLALDNALQNADGFWTKAGEYTLYQDTKGVFHVVMWDVNESFKEPGRGGGAGMLDPYAGSGDSQKSMLYCLLRVPAYEQKYLGYMHDIAQNWMSWEKLGPEIERIQALLKADIALDQRKLYSTESFLTSAVQDYYNPGASSPRPPEYSLKGFLAERRAYLLSYPGIARAPAKK